MNAQIVKLLKTGRELVSRGWCKQDLFQDASGQGTASTHYQEGYSCCAMGGIYAAKKMANAEEDNYDVAVRLLNSCAPKDFRTKALSVYNDAPETTKEDILALYDRAIFRMNPEVTLDS